jgi:transcriptional regulator with XRE-family HTH domain
MRKPKNRLAFLRMSKLWSQYDMAKFLGISQSYYAKLERDPSQMSVQMAANVKRLVDAPSIESMLDAI